MRQIMKTISSFTVLIGTLSLTPYLTECFRCGYHTDKERGYISTPNFPKPYPVPIFCQWIIEAPLDYKIAIYFTQFYLKTGFSASEFAHFMKDIGIGVSKSDFGMISSNDEPTYLVSNQRILVLNLHVYSLDNVHLRVTEHLLEVYGFNITYEVLERNDSVRQDSCIYHHCSFTGFCLASENLLKYSCDCVAGYFGEECQYDEDCGPTSTTQVCYNGGTCRYYIGSTVRTCECPSGFEGAKCERRSPLKNESEQFLAALESDRKCESRHHYTSHPDYIAIYPDNGKCPPRGKEIYVIKAEINLIHFKPTSSEKDLKDTMKKIIWEQLNSSFSNGINIAAFSVNDDSLEMNFVAESENTEKIKSIQNNLTRIENDRFSIELHNVDLQVKSLIFIERMEMSEKMPIMEGIPLLLACIVRGGPNTTVKWLKDNSPIIFPEAHGRLWNTTIPKNSFNSFTFLLGNDKTHVLDSGAFTCEATDETGIDKLTIPVTVKQLSKPLLTPLSATIRFNDSLTITCVSQEIHRDRNVTYIWSKNEGSLVTSKEKVEDLFPSGSRIIITRAVESANYTCAIHSVFGIKKETSIIKVVREKEFSTSTCPKETLFGINWKLTAVDSEDFHLCPYNYTGYIFRKCIRTENQSIVWQQPDFSRCLSGPFLKIKNGFESYKIGYRIHNLNMLLKKTLATLKETITHLHMSEAEPLVDILSDIHFEIYLRENATENWQIILNITSKLLNYTAVSRIQSKKKLNNFIRNISMSYGRKYISHNSSEVFESSALIVKIWKVERDMQKYLHFPGFGLSSNATNVEVSIGIFNSSTSEGNSSVTAVMIIYRNHMFVSAQEYSNSYTVLREENSSIPVISVETKCSACEDNIAIKVILTFKHIFRRRKKVPHISCYKIFGTERNQNIQSCEEVDIFEENLLCRCYSTGLLSVILLEKKFEMKKESGFPTECKILPISAAVISVAFLFYTLSIFRYRKKFSSLFE